MSHTHTHTWPLHTNPCIDTDTYHIYSSHHLDRGPQALQEGGQELGAAPALYTCVCWGVCVCGLGRLGLRRLQRVREHAYTLFLLSSPLTSHTHTISPLTRHTLTLLVEVLLRGRHRLVGDKLCQALLHRQQILLPQCRSPFPCGLVVGVALPLLAVVSHGVMVQQRCVCIQRSEDRAPPPLDQHKNTKQG